MAKLLAFKGTKAKGNLFEIAVTGSADELARELDRDKGSECRKILPHVTELPPCIDKLEGTFSLVVRHSSPSVRPLEGRPQRQ